jgi:hypothetical protein
MNVLFARKHPTFIVRAQDVDVELNAAADVRHFYCRIDKALQILIVLFR